MVKKVETSAQPGRLGVLEILRAGDWFQGLTDSLLQEIASLSVLRTYQAGEVLVHRDEPGNAIYGIISGQVRVYTESAQGRELALNTMVSGDIFGEIAALDGGRRTATNRAVEQTIVFVIPRPALRALMLREPAIALHLIEVLCARVRRASQQVEDAAFLTVPERLARLLQQMVEDAGGRTPCQIKMSQTELAAFLNASRQVVNSCLQQWQRSGYAQVGRGRVEILDVEGIMKTAEIDS